MDYVNFVTDDATFHHGDVCYLKSKHIFGTIRELLTVNKTQYADLQHFNSHYFDSESNIPFSDTTPSAAMSVEKLSDISEPLVTAVDGDKVWFVSHYSGNNNFVWLDYHLGL